MDFGRSPIAVYTQGRSGRYLSSAPARLQRMSGLLEADILLHYKAISNVRNRQMFFPTNSRGQSKLGTVVATTG